MMSGGVDSSVTAMLLRDAGFNVVGITMKIPMAECDTKRSCCGMEAVYVCRALGLPHYYLDVTREFRSLVIEPFRRAYMAGRTPSPCVDCNTALKFGVVWDALGPMRVATGHYAQVIRENDNTYLARAKDVSRDQSYFLYGIRRDKLADLYLPLGDYTKTEVRRLARKAALPVARREDSMELCFAGEGDYRDALGEEAFKPGPILDVRSNEIGRHKGVASFTIGQRKGIGVAAKEPLFVIGIDPAANSITVGPRDAALTNAVSAEEINVLIPEELKIGKRLAGKIRSQGDPCACAITRVEDSRIEVNFDEPQFAPTPGQRLVLYDDQDRVVAGGVLEVRGNVSP